MKEEYKYVPYSLLTSEEFDSIRAHLHYETAKKNEVLLVQELTNVDKFRLVISGVARFYFEFNFTETLKRDLCEGDSFGGISILLNEGIATKTLRVVEDTKLLTLDANHFLKLCEKNEAFTEFFTRAFGKSMVNRTYAGIISRQVKDKELNLPFFNQPISAMYRPIIATCTKDTSIKTAAQMMARTHSSSLLVTSDSRIEGIVTDADLRERAIAQELKIEMPVEKIMSSPVISISDGSLVYEAFLTMIEKDVRHLMLINHLGEIIGVMTEKDLITAQANSTYLLIKTVKAARNIAQLENIHSRLVRMLLTPIQNGSSTEYITKLITAFSDAIIDKVISFAIEELGPPPCKFCFMIMGSEGREEQTFISDQDNALVYEDISSQQDKEKTAGYFNELSEKICNQLHTAGYKLCSGDNMAKNTKWCQPLSVWKDYFTRWIHAAKPKDLLYSSIFFDFRGIWGETCLAEELKTHLLLSIEKWPGFLRNLTENAIYFKPPITLFRRFVVEKEGEHKGSFDIKISILPIIDLARVYSLQHGIRETNTLRRFFRLHKKRVINDEEYRDLVQTYGYLMRLRFLRQITIIIDEEKEPDNFINPAELSYLDQAVLKKIFWRIKKYQEKLSFDFTGTP